MTAQGAEEGLQGDLCVGHAVQAGRAINATILRLEQARPTGAGRKAPGVQPHPSDSTLVSRQNQPRASIAFLSRPSCCGGAAVLLACLMTNSIFHPHLIMQQSLMGQLPPVLFPGVGWCRPEDHSLCSVSCPARHLHLHL